MSSIQKLVTVIGTGPYKPMVYDLKGKRSSKVRYAPVALLELLDWSEGSREVVVFLTEKAEQVHKDPLKSEVLRREFNFRCASIPMGSREEEIWQIFNAVANEVHEGDELVVDVTHGFRSLPILVIGALMFLKEVKPIVIKGVYYGNWEARDEEACVEPIFELTPLLDMMEWAHAARIFQKYGHADEIGKLLKKVQDHFAKRTDTGGFPRLLKTMGGYLEAVSFGIAEGLPLEIGYAAKRLTNLDHHKIEDEIRRFAVPAGSISPMLLGSFADMALQAEKPKREWKKTVQLNEWELNREARIVDWYLERAQIGLALGIIREWMVNRVIIALEKQQSWLDYREARKIAERKLNALAELHREYSDLLSDHEATLAGWWRTVADLRNSFRHSGFRAEEIKQVPIESLLALWQEIKSRATLKEWWEAGRSRFGEKTVLLSSLGLSRGLLYSAICRVCPDRAVIVTSEEAKSRLSEVLEKAGASDLNVKVLVMKDPFCGYEEYKDLVGQVARELLKAGKVVVNQTGGTTVMQFVLQKMVEELKRFDVPFEEVAFVDRRPVEEQRNNPYVLGEMVILSST